MLYKLIAKIKNLCINNMINNLALACDHAGLKLKEIIFKHLQDLKINYQDYGTNSEVSVDYPDYAAKVAEAIINNTAQAGILICGTGIGMSIAANRYKQIRAALCTDPFMAQMAREHNDANILVLGARITNPQNAIDCVSKFLSTKFTETRHLTRIAKLS